jgi:hypothetical protein
VGEVLATINRFIFTIASGRAVLTALFVTVLSFVLMAFVIAPEFGEATSGLKPFDLNFGITAEMIYQQLPSYTDLSRRIYVQFAIIDFIYPAAAASFFVLLWAWLFKRAPNRFFKQVADLGMLPVPFLFAIVDWLENFGFLIVIFSYPAKLPAIASSAGTLKATKPLIELVIVVATLVFVTVVLWDRRQRRLNDKPPVG